VDWLKERKAREKWDGNHGLPVKATPKVEKDPKVEYPSCLVQNWCLLPVSVGGMDEETVSLVVISGAELELLLR
jgi:hypothetical protein